MGWPSISLVNVKQYTVPDTGKETLHLKGLFQEGVKGLMLHSEKDYCNRENTHIVRSASISKIRQKRFYIL